MLTSYLMGGMGNQMFQYAMGLAQARRLGVDLQLEWWKENETADVRRRYGLGLWEGVTQPLVSDVPVTVSYLNLNYNQLVIDKIVDGDCIQGYWQTEKYFHHIRNELLQIFKPKSPMTDRSLSLLDEIGKEGNKSVFLAVRRADYVGSGFGALPREYYAQACDIIAEEVCDPHFFVISDDPEWCKSSLSLPYRCTVVEGGDTSTYNHLGREDEEIWAMRNCHHAIIANSSYSWWGAWLSPLRAVDRIVVAPKKWLWNMPEVNTDDVVPDRWIKIGGA